MKVSHRISQLAQGGILTLLLITVLVVPLLYSPHLGEWRGVKLAVFETMAFALVGLALSQAALPRNSRRLIEFLRVGPNLPLLLLVIYGAFSWSRSTAPDFSRAEWLRLACGAGLYFVVSTALRQRDQVRTVVDVLCAVAILTSLFGFVAYGQPDATSMSSSFGNRQLFAGFLLMLVPLLLVLSFGEPDPLRKMVAQVAAVVAVASLLMAQTRSSWLGAIVALIALGAMAIRYAPTGSSLARNRHQLVLPLVIVVGALSLFLLVSGSTPMLSSRAGTLASPQSDGSLGWRWNQWQGTCKMILEKPLFGFGIGTFPLERARFVPGALPKDAVRRLGPSLAEQAHNEYLQIAAEMGFVGLALNLWMLGAFFVFGLRALRGREQGYRKLVLMGAIAAMAGQTVDALSNPAWRFADVSLMFWLMMGLGMASARVHRRSAAEEGEPTTAGAGRAWGRLGWQVTSLGLAVVAMSSAWAQGGLVSPVPTYTGPIELRIEPETATLQPGQCMEFRLMARASNQVDFIDVTNSQNTQFQIDNDLDRFCLVSNTTVDRSVEIAPNVFCVPKRACTALGCGGPRTVRVNASYLSRADAVATATVTMTCP
jgi:O-antigen ligase